MRGEEDDLVGRCGAAEDGDGVPGLFARDVLEPGDALLGSRGKWIGERGLLEEGVVVAAGLRGRGLEAGRRRRGLRCVRRVWLSRGREVRRRRGSSYLHELPVAVRLSAMSFVWLVRRTSGTVVLAMWRLRLVSD